MTTTDDDDDRRHTLNLSFYRIIKIFGCHKLVPTLCSKLILPMSIQSYKATPSDLIDMTPLCSNIVFLPNFGVGATAHPIKVK